jgi:hypothetical protein
MDYTPLISATRASHARIQATPLDARLLIVSADPTPGFMLTAYERINPGLKLMKPGDCWSKSNPTPRSSAAILNAVMESSCVVPSNNNTQH